MQGVSCSEMIESDVPERSSGTLSVFCAMNSKESSVQRSKHASQSPSMLEKSENGKIIHDNVSLRFTATSRSPERNDKCSGDDSFCSSFPGSPRNRKSRDNIFEELNSLVSEDYDYTKSTEYSYAVKPQYFDRNNASRSITYDTGDEGSEGNKECLERGLFLLDKNRTDIPSNLIEAEVSSIFLPHPEKSSTEMKREKEKAKELGPVCVGKYAEQRRELDYSYHSQYTPERQLFHDILIDRFFDTTVRDEETHMTCDRPRDNWLVFTAGCMGAGKGHTLTWLHSQGIFPLDAFVRVDPDALRELLPETRGYIKRDPSTAGYLTQKEVGCICEVLTISALEQGKNVLVDGSLRDASWYLQYISDLRWRFPKLKIAIIYVTASPQTILTRATRRAEATGRMVPKEVILKTMRALPRSIRMLSPIVDFVVTFENEEKPGVPRLLHSIRRNSSAFLASLDTQAQASSGLSGDRFKEDSKEYSFDSIEDGMNHLTSKGSENFLSDKFNASKHSPLLNSYGDVTYELQRRNSSKISARNGSCSSDDVLKESLNRSNNVSKKMGEEIDRMIKGVSEIESEIVIGENDDNSWSGDDNDGNGNEDEDDDGSLFYISYTEGDLHGGDSDEDLGCDKQREKAIKVTGERNADFDFDFYHGEAEGSVEGEGEGKGEEVMEEKNGHTKSGKSQLSRNSCSTKTLEGYRAHKGDWKEEFRSVWKMQCAFR